MALDYPAPASAGQKWIDPNNTVWNYDGIRWGRYAAKNAAVPGYPPVPLIPDLHLVTIDLGGGVIDAAWMPDTGSSATYTVNSEAAMLALTIEQGDICIRTDINESFRNLVGANGALGDWAVIGVTTLDMGTLI